MSKQPRFVGVTLIFCWLSLSQSIALAQTAVELPWSEIAPLIVDREIALALPDGTYIRGKALAVQADALEMDVKKTSDSRLHPKGHTTIPRASASVIELRQMRKFPVGAIAGGGAGYVGGVYLGYGIGRIATKEDEIGGPLLGAMISAIAGAIVGGRLGHDLDQRNTLIKIVPEPPNFPLDPTQTGCEAMDFDDSSPATKEARSDSITGMSVVAGPR
ncbi:MAG: hypothetical protein HYX73_08380 [Acidobacteria bacterium]|nr:hypothetical protein [Acidobacteriota bacterium]